MGRCGRCRGRGVIKPMIGFGDQECPACKGTGVKVQKSSLGSRSASIPLPPGARCIVCNRPAIQMHHLVSQHRLDRYLGGDEARTAKRDPRNGVPACVHCHGGLDDESIQLSPSQLPHGFGAFIATYHLEAALPRYMTCGTAAPSASVSQGTVVTRSARPSREESV